MLCMRHLDLYMCCGDPDIIITCTRYLLGGYLNFLLLDKSAGCKWVYPARGTVHVHLEQRSAADGQAIGGHAGWTFWIEWRFH